MSEKNDIFYFNESKIEIKIIYQKNTYLEPIVLLHEGLGSISSWKDWPLKLSQNTERTVILYSRIGMGNSSPIKADRNSRYMHEEATNILPNLLKYLDVTNPILLGHSDGASIALIYAGSGYKSKCLILEAPHVFVEKISITGIKNTKYLWKNNNLKDKLNKHHNDVDGAFHGWYNIWTSKEFRNWNIEEYLPKIHVPILMFQGLNDEYGTLKQLDSIENSAKGKTTRIELEDCGHSPHSLYPNKIIDKIKEFININ